MSEKIKPPVGLASWQGGFQLVQVSRAEAVRESLLLTRFRVPKLKNGKPCRFALTLSKRYADGREAVVWQKLLPVMNKGGTKKYIDAALAERRERKAAFAKLLSADDAKPDLTESQLRWLSKAYPKTIALLRQARPENVAAAFESYQIETLALTGSLVGSLSKKAFKETAKRLGNAARRKTAPLDEAALELIAGWTFKGYQQMKPAHRAAALKAAGLGSFSTEAIRRKCDRLQLPPARKRGAPRGARPIK